RHGERHVELLGQRLHQQRLAAAGGAEQQDVPLLDLHLARFAVLSDPLVVVVHRHGERLLGAVLPDDVLVQLVVDLARARVLRPLGGLFLGDDVVAQGDTLVADEDARPGDQLAHLTAPLPTEGAVEVVHQGRVLHQVCAAPSAGARGRREDPSGDDFGNLPLIFGRTWSRRRSCRRRRRRIMWGREMRALVVTSNPATAASEADSPAAALNDLGCEVVAVGYDVDQLPEDIELQRPSVVVVDAGAHLEVGRAAIRRVREVGSLADVPVLLCVEVSRLAGLDPEAGADDFVLAPVVGPELYARIRQPDWRMSSIRAAGRIKIGDLIIDAVAVEATYRGRALKLPRQEFQLLKFLAERPGRVFSREQLLSRVWGYRYAGGTRTVDIHVRRLRAKLGPGSAMIETVRHVGYKLRPPQA